MKIQKFRMLMIFAVILVLKSTFKSPVIRKFTYFRFNKHWNMHRGLVTLVGFVQSGFMYFMPLLILNVAGDETVFGKIELSTATISVFVIYILGRITSSHHRSFLMFIGASLLTTGGIILSFLIDNDDMIFSIIKISVLGVIIMKVFQVAAEPIINMAFSATNLSDIEKVSAMENRDSYSYVFDKEFFMNGGRILGGVVFIALNYLISPLAALQYIFIVLGLFQILSSFLIKKLNAVELNTSKANH